MLCTGHAAFFCKLKSHCSDSKVQLLQTSQIGAEVLHAGTLLPFLKAQSCMPEELVTAHVAQVS